MKQPCNQVCNTSRSRHVSKYNLFHLNFVQNFVHSNWLDTCCSISQQLSVIQLYSIARVLYIGYYIHFLNKNVCQRVCGSQQLTSHVAVMKEFDVSKSAVFSSHIAECIPTRILCLNSCQAQTIHFTCPLKSCPVCYNCSSSTEFLL